MSDILVLKAILAAGELAAASAALPALAWLTARAFPRSAARRHLAWAVALSGLVAIPLLAAVSPSLTSIVLPAAPALAVAGTAAVSGPAPSDWAALLIPGVLLGVLTVWAMGVLWVGGRALLAVAGLELLRRRGALCPPERYMPGAARVCELRFSEACPGPMTWGVLRPVVMLPWAALGWSKTRLDAVMRHELAHVRRRDALTQAVAMTACALYWPNPLVWQATSELRREAEAAADDAVIAAGVRPSDYASELLELAKEWRGQRQTFAMAMAAPAALTERVQSILSTDPIRTGATAMDILKLAALGGLATATLVLARPSLAETAPPAPVAELLPPAPPAPAAVPAIPAVPAVRAVAAVPSMPAVPSVPAVAKAPKVARNHGKVVVDGQVIEGAASRPMTAEERAELRRELAEIGPRVHKAIADARIHETVQKSLAEARIDERVQKELARIQPRIDAAMAKAEAARARAEVARARAEADIARAEAAREAADHIPHS